MLSRSDSPIMRREPPAPEVGDDIFEPDEEPDYGQDQVYERNLYRASQGISPLPQWEELTEVEGRFLLRHDGKVYAAVEVPADSIIAQAFKP